MKVVVGLLSLISLFTIGKIISKFPSFTNKRCSINLTYYFSTHVVLGNGELSILHSPNGINFKGDEAVKSSELPKIISTSLGHTTQTVIF
jgi:hypothetical protein